jgi:hypothetical protein
MAPQAPRAPGASTPVGAPPRVASLQPEPNSPLTARPSHATRSRGGGRSSGQRSARLECAAVGCGCHRGCHPSYGKPSHHGRVGGVNQNIHMDLATPQPELMVRAASICGKSHVAEAVQHVPEQGGKPGAVQPVATEPSVGS